MDNPQTEQFVTPPNNLEPKRSWLSRHMVLGYVFLFAVGAAAVSGIYYWQTVRQIPTSVQTPAHKDAMADWKTYTNTQYGFEVKYPQNWKIASDAAWGGPRFSIYKTEAAPISFDANATTVSIFPGGLVTEGSAGRTKEVSFDLTGADEKIVVEYSTESGEPFGYYIGFKTFPASWSSDGYGYVWGSALITSYSSVQECSTPCEGIPNLWVKGNVDKADMAIVKKILSTFKFTPPTSAVDTSTWKTYTNTQYGFEVKYPADKISLGTAQTGIGKSNAVFLESGMSQETIQIYPQGDPNESDPVNSTNKTVREIVFAGKKAQETSWMQNGQQIRRLNINESIPGWSDKNVIEIAIGKQEDLVNQILSTFKFTK